MLREVWPALERKRYSAPGTPCGTATVEPSMWLVMRAVSWSGTGTNPGVPGLRTSQFPVIFVFMWSAMLLFTSLLGSVDCVLRLGLFRLQCSIPCSEILELPNPGQHLVKRVTMDSQNPRVRANSPEPPPAFRHALGCTTLHFCVLYNTIALSRQAFLSFIFQCIPVMLLS